MRRLLGPVGGPVMFFLIAALVFGGLGWVTVAALRVETAQRETAAQAELGSKLREALWRLDGRMLLPLGGEDSRPFYHYTSPDPLSGSTAGPTPLLAAPLPDYMKLHVQLDPVTGWESPQVLAPEACTRVADAWPELPLRNNTVERAEALKAVKVKCPADATWAMLCARERAAPDDSRPFAAPLFDPLPSANEPLVPVPPASTASKPAPSPEMEPVSVGTAAEHTSEAFRILGWEFRRVAPAEDRALTQVKKDAANTAPATNTAQTTPPPAPKAAAPNAQIAAQQMAANAGQRGSGRGQMSDNERQMADYQNRVGPITRGAQEAKNAGQDFPMYGKGYQQNINPAGDGKPQAGLGNSVQPFNGGIGNFQPQGQPGQGGGGFNYGPGDGERDGRSGRAPAPALDLDKLSKDVVGERAGDLLKKLQGEQFRDLFREQPAEGRKQVVDVDADDRAAAILATWALGVACAGGTPAAPPRAVPPGEDRPPQPVFNSAIGNNINFNVAGPPAVNIHLGSMRPQWITAADGTEMLVLVRAAKIDDKTVYQGVILDWPKLEQLLKDEVRDLFPEARLVPVKDASNVSPDRAMTALPVQLDPGPTPALPPGGWTPLRLGLVLAWVAALVAFAAVGLSGWSLIDLAERRIRFVSAVTHELRTPLTSLRLYLDLLMSGMIHDEAKRQEYLSTLATESDRLHRLIDNVLDFAKLEKRAKNGDMKPVKVADLVEQLRATWTDRVAADGKELVVISTLPAEVEVCTDAAMVQQIVGNLIDNARKYTRDAEDKRIWLWVKPGGAGRVVLEVEDRGCGVAPSERKTIFKPFRRGEHADTKAGGAGLGLALAKQWAEVLGGTVAYRPAEGAPGACFRLELPVK